jgi:hypothetical protein
MEELIVQLSGGSVDILLLVGWSQARAAPSQLTLFHIAQIQKKCPRVHVVVFVNKGVSEGVSEGGSEVEVDVSCMNPDHVHVMDSTQSSESPILREWLRLCSCVFLVDMYFSVESDSGSLTTTTKTILDHFSTAQHELKITCLHSEQFLKQKKSMARRAMRNGQEPSASASASVSASVSVGLKAGMTNLTSAFEGLTIVHMVRET